MTDKQSGGPAFPLHNHGAQTLGLHLSGMTLRDYFAAKAMQAVMNDWMQSFDVFQDADTAECIARDCYIVADAMLKARDGAADKPADPCPGCRPGIVCRTPFCGRLKQRNGNP